MSETKSPYFKVEKQSPINKASAMIEDYLSGLKKEFGDLHRAISDIEAWNEDLRRENGEFLDKLHEKDLEIKELRANWENEKQHVLDMREGVRLGGELAKEVERLRAALKKYGRHSGYCHVSTYTCYCGLDEALSPPSPTPNDLDKGDSQSEASRIEKSHDLQ